MYSHIYIYIYIYIHVHKAASQRAPLRAHLCGSPKAVCWCLRERTLLRNRRHTGAIAFRAPAQGLESSFCCWTAGQGLAQKEHAIFRRHLMRVGVCVCALRTKFGKK